MKKQLLLVALLSQGLTASARHLDSVFEDIKQTMDSFQKHFDAIDKYMEESFPSFQELKQLDKLDEEEVQKKLVEVSSDKDNVIVKLHLGELDVQEINIEADGDTLNGVVPLKDGSANSGEACSGEACSGEACFYVQNGRLFGISFKHEIKKEAEDASVKKDIQAKKAEKKQDYPEQDNPAQDNPEKMQYIESSESTKVESLPDQVDVLEKTQVVYKDGILELLLPRVPEKKGIKLHVNS